MSKELCMSATLSNEQFQPQPRSHLVDIDIDNNLRNDIRLDTFTSRENRRPQPIDVGIANSHHSRPVDINLAHSPSPMPRKANGSNSRPSRATGSAPSSASSTQDEGNMSGNLLEQRRKHASLESPDSATMTANLMSRSSFTLDNAPPPTPHPEAASKGFTDLPEQDKRNFLLLVLLYFLQGIPMGLASGSVPFLLKSHLSYGQIGWALTLLSPSNLSYASTAQTVGLTAGQFLSYTVFLALSSKDFANKWFRSAPGDTGLLTLGGYLSFWGWAYLVVTLGLAFLKKEDKTKERDGIMEVYRVMGGILSLKNIQTFIVIHLIAKIGFQANDAVTNLKLLEKGFSQEDLALTVLIDFPFEISLGYYAGKWSEQYAPMRLWCWAFVGRLVAAAFAQFTVMIFPSGGTNLPYLCVVIVEHVFSTFMSTVMFVAVSAFHAKIADPHIGGTYMTLLATVSNLGGTFPRFFILKFVDMFTAATCVPASIPPPDFKGDLITKPFSCALENDRHICVNGGGSCNITTDGYYIVNVLCIIIGVVTFWGFIKPAALKLQSLPLRAWRIADQ
ncbi:hypothetical protein D6D27_00662 [Aureobasidium pullulans]|nr:hypothetical protein D6D27_00662 [Aureobasidium pullulans]